jgi:hypothetical protein
MPTPCEYDVGLIRDFEIFKFWCDNSESKFITGLGVKSTDCEKVLYETIIERTSSIMVAFRI